ncbi:MAG TPA: ABC transporter permease, partial [Patescibacteria group bacterium]|nr:ABC transporter permease [Patescibacteria group bacterium]
MTLFGLNLRRVWGVVLRSSYVLKHNLDRLTDMLYWPVLDLMLWGVTSKYFTEASGTGDIVLLVLSGLVFWGVFWRGQYEVPLNLLEDIWGQNLINMFASPLKFSE